MEPNNTAYNPKEVEDRIYDFWLKNGYFNPDTQPNVHDGAKSFCITIPPPNVTGSLHMGHALNNTLQDVLVRRARMMGRPTLWIPGTDHAGIATQNVVEKKLRKSGKSRHDLGREEFIKEVWTWKNEYGNKIIDQLKKLGCSCDWSRERFTMDDDYTKAIEFAFKRYFDKGYIYQGTRVVNWCVRCQTSISDLEVEHVKENAKLYYFKYDKDFPITIATTRPETKLGDVAVAVNPSDKRYKKYIGQTFDVNFAGVKREIKIISDKSIDMEFGTGALGVTPAHSLIDSEMAQKNSLPEIQIIDKYGKMTAEAGEDFVGLKAKEASEKIIAWLEKEKLLEKVEDITHNLSTCERCHSALEPQPSKQWFVKMQELAKLAIEAIEKDQIKYYPNNWKKVSLDWLKNIKDWCISRQLWWGHRLPVWQPELKVNSSEFKADEVYVGNTPPKGWVQSEDVLDTWFSSALWPFATLGWPEKSKDLEKFFPTSTLITDRGIIYLWVARMIFSSLEFMQEVPFSEVYINPTVFNKDGKRMSKSLGTGVDPIELIEKFGTDATRFGLTFQDTGTQDLKFSEESILAGKKFANKMWNAARFVETNLVGFDCHPEPLVGRRISSNSDSSFNSQNDPKPITQADKKILESLEMTIKQVNGDLDKYRFGQALETLYDFFWHDFCDKYIEEAKNQLKTQISNLKSNEEDFNNEDVSQNTQYILLYTLVVSLKLIHPFMPFVTEEIYQNLKKSFNDTDDILFRKSLMVSDWPNCDKINVK
jgi:valyl-tRNA synthetase